MKCRGIGPHLAAMGKSHEFSRVATGTWCLFSRYGGDGHLKLGFFSAKSGLRSCYDGHLGKLNYTWQENTDVPGGEPGGQASHVSSLSYICIPINFHEYSGIVPF